MREEDVDKLIQERLGAIEAKLDRILSALPNVKPAPSATSTGVDRRSQIDTETVRALLLINGGGAIALLTLLPSILDKPKFEPLASAVLFGLFIFMCGLICAVLHNRYRRKCSLIHDQHNFRPPSASLFGFKLKKPLVCWISEKLMVASILCFFVAGCYVAVRGIVVMSS